MSARKIWKRVAIGAAMVTALTVGVGVGAQAEDGENLVAPEAAPKAGVSSPTESGFVPITPCRIVNTATSGAGKIAANETRAYKMHGNTAGQGGAAGCGIPDRASALEVNITAPLASGDGYLRTAPAGVPIPNATFLNYEAGFNASNAGTIRVTQGGGNNFQIKAHNASTHAVVDVLGYYVEDLFAVINANGTFARGNEVSFVTRSAVGTYRVRFGRNVRGCNYTGTVGEPGPSGAQADGTVTVAGEGANVNGVFVKTYAQSGAAADRPFHLQVDC